MPSEDLYTALVQMVISGLNSTGLCSGGSICGFTPQDITDLFCRINQNSFTVSDPELQPLGVGMYGLASCINHSCSPNAVTSFDLSPASLPAISARTISPIRGGGEVTTSYIDITPPSSERRASLRRDYNFTCTCVSCSSPELPALASLRSDLVRSRGEVEEMLEGGRYQEALTALRPTPGMWEALTPEYFPVKGLELLKLAKLEASFGDMGRAAEMRVKGEEIFKVCYGAGSANFQKIMKATLG